jgi:CRISPR-associated protein Cas2
MIYWVIYDISKNSTRNRVASTCKNYGLKRIQKSAFLGNITKNKADMLAIQCKDIVKEQSDCVFIIPACEQCFKCREIVGVLDETAAQKLNYLIVGEHGEQATFNSG